MLKGVVANGFWMVPAVRRGIAMQDITKEPTSMQGGLRMISPEEPFHAYLFAIARDIVGGKPDTDLLQWKAGLLSVTCCFREMANLVDMFWFCSQERENLGAEFKAVGRTGVQRVDEIVYFMGWMEETIGKLSAKKCADEYRRRLCVPKALPAGVTPNRFVGQWSMHTHIGIRAIMIIHISICICTNVHDGNGTR
jgi:hypothetical protein